MKKVFLLSLVLLICAGVAAAQSGSTSKGRIYDPATETTITGQVADVAQHAGRGRGTGTHLMLETSAGRVEVHLGPTSYLAAQNASYAKGDKVTVTGSKVKFGSSEVIIAREVKKGDQVLTLRDAQGIPKWSRGRQRPN